MGKGKAVDSFNDKRKKENKDAVICQFDSFQQWVNKAQSWLYGYKSKDIIALDKILATNLFERPNLKLSIYKNRRGRYKGVILWCKANLGTCRVKPMFCTTYDYEMVSIDDVRINVLKEDSAFEED